MRYLSMVSILGAGADSVSNEMHTSNYNHKYAFKYYAYHEKKTRKKPRSVQPQ